MNYLINILWLTNWYVLYYRAMPLIEYLKFFLLKFLGYGPNKQLSDQCNLKFCSMVKSLFIPFGRSPSIFIVDHNENFFRGVAL